MPKSKWKRQMKAIDDKQQMILEPTSPTGATIRPRDTITFTPVHTKPVTCPFCLYTATIEQFLISTKKGLHKALGKCSECNNKMRLKTLTREWTPEQFAEWCHEYSASGFWSKVPFAKFRTRLYRMGWSRRFWERYKELKGEDTTESYEDMVNREAKEQYDYDMGEVK